MGAAMRWLSKDRHGVCTSDMQRRPAVKRPSQQGWPHCWSSRTFELKMAIFGKTVPIFLVWLTAISTLIAGLPRLECRCPNGHVKPFCISSILPLAGGCGGDGKCCCGKRGIYAGCCARHSLEHGRPSLQRSSCVKTPASGTIAIVEAKTAVVQDFVTATGCPAALPGNTCCSADVRGRLLAKTHLLPPPADLITLLGHLLI